MFFSMVTRHNAAAKLSQRFLNHGERVLAHPHPRPVTVARLNHKLSVRTHRKQLTAPPRTATIRGLPLPFVAINA